MAKVPWGKIVILVMAAGLVYVFHAQLQSLAEYMQPQFASRWDVVFSWVFVAIGVGALGLMSIITVGSVSKKLV